MDKHQEELFLDGLRSHKTVVDMRDVGVAERGHTRSKLVQTFSSTLAVMNSGLSREGAEVQSTSPIYTAMVAEVKDFFGEDVALTPAVAAALVPGMDSLLIALESTSLSGVEKRESLKRQVEDAGAGLLVYRLLELGLKDVVDDKARDTQLRHMGERLADVRRGALFDKIHDTELPEEARVKIDQVLLQLRDVGDGPIARETLTAYNEAVARAAAKIKGASKSIDWNTLGQHPLITNVVGPAAFLATVSGDRQELRAIRSNFVDSAK